MKSNNLISVFDFKAECIKMNVRFCLITIFIRGINNNIDSITAYFWIFWWGSSINPHTPTVFGFAIFILLLPKVSFRVITVYGPLLLFKVICSPFVFFKIFANFRHVFINLFLSALVLFWIYIFK